MKKKFIIITLSIILLISLTTFITFKFVSSKSNSDNPVNTSEKQDIKVPAKDNDVKEEPLQDDTSTPQEEMIEQPKEETDHKDTIDNSNSSSSSNTNKDQNINNVKPTIPPEQNNNINVSETIPSCTPKKFYTSFRADFKTHSECDSVGKQYKSKYGYLGFYCDYQTDDCGVTYYMLQFYDSNGIEYGYDTILKP